MKFYLKLYHKLLKIQMTIHIILFKEIRIVEILMNKIIVYIRQDFGKVQNHPLQLIMKDFIYKK